MTDTLRDRIAKALHRIYSPSLDDDDWDDEPHMVQDDYRRDADAILALPGVAVVELPEPDYDGDDGDGGVGWGTGDNCVFASGGMVYDQCGEFSPAQAREIGLLRWLAAADYAEREQ